MIKVPAALVCGEAVGVFRAEAQGRCTGAERDAEEAAGTVSDEGARGDTGNGAEVEAF